VIPDPSVIQFNLTRSTIQHLKTRCFDQAFSSTSGSHKCLRSASGWHYIL